jgi:hypothetical protein
MGHPVRFFLPHGILVVGGLSVLQRTGRLDQLRAWGSSLLAGSERTRGAAAWIIPRTPFKALVAGIRAMFEFAVLHGCRQLVS